jgi:RNase adapter protein RapZ
MRHPPTRKDTVTDTAIRVVITTYGVLHGQAPAGDALTVDLRTALRNPHRDPAMRYKTGLDPEVREHVLATPGADRIIAHTVERVLAVLHAWADPHNLRSDLHVYCKGGRHRSVAIAEAVADRLRTFGVGVEVEHRDILKPVVRSIPQHPTTKESDTMARNQRQQVSASSSDKDFNTGYAQNLASDGADIARRGRAAGNLELEQFGNQMMDNALDHLKAQSG